MDLNVSVTGAHDLLTANGDTSGFVTVASNAPYYVGATVWLRSSVVDGQEYIITTLSGSTKIQVRLKNAAASYGFSDVSAYTTTDNATVDQVAGVVPILSNGTIQKKDKA